MITRIEGGTVVDGTEQEPRRAAVMIEGERIVAVGKQPADGAEGEVVTIDASGCTVLPGLIDSHTHLAEVVGEGFQNDLDQFLMADTVRSLNAAHNAWLTLRGGITTVREVGSRNCIDLALREAVARHLVPGPRIVAAGQIIAITSAGSGIFKGMYREADGVGACRRAVRELVQLGVDLIKIQATGAYANRFRGEDPGRAQLTIPEMQAICDEAHRAGRRVAAHAHGTQGIKDAVLAGVDTIEHGTALDAEGAAMMADRGVFLVPTLMPDHPSGTLVQAFQHARQAGVKVAMSTDAQGTKPYMTHGQNARQVGLLVDLGGLTPLEAIAAATRVGAACLDRAAEIGTLEPGKLADIVVVEGDVLANIHLLDDPTNIAYVLQGGRLAAGRRARPAV